MIQLQEHGIIEGIVNQDDRFEHLSLVSWSRPMDCNPWGYYASYKIGAEWIDDNEALVVTTKRDLENIDFLSMFMTCFSSNLSIDSFSEIYSIKTSQSPIEAPSLIGVLSPLIVFHFIGVVSRIKALKKGYVHRSDNLKKIKGRVSILKNERRNIALRRYDRIYCDYDEFSLDIPENRLLKKALLYSKRFVLKMGENHLSYNTIKHTLSRCLALFENVSSNIEIKDIQQIKCHKLFKEYSEAIRLAKLVLSHFDYSINKVGDLSAKVTPFTLDMSLLYEHYVYGMLYNAYKEDISYQFKGKTGYPDFLYRSEEFKAILDTKYIPKYKNVALDTYIVRQLSGYSRDIPIIRHLGYQDIDEESPTPSIPCVIIYPDNSDNPEHSENPFMHRELRDLCKNKVPGLSQFYKIGIPIPILE